MLKQCNRRYHCRNLVGSETETDPDTWNEGRSKHAAEIICHKAPALKHPAAFLQTELQMCDRHVLTTAYLSFGQQMLAEVVTKTEVVLV